MSKKLKCREYGCSEVPFRNGLCEEHYEESQGMKHKRDAAINTLHTGMIDGRLPDNGALREELFKLRKWWFRACDSINNKIEDKVLRDEAKYALEWCIAIAQEIIKEDMAVRRGDSVDTLTHEIKRMSWERFENLEAGLMSNGVTRPPH